jgi:agmatinase
MAPPPRTHLPDARRTPRFAGLMTFARVPRLEDLDAAAAAPDWVVYGVPHDGGVTYRPGARFGPRAIREASQYAKPYLLELDVNVAERLSLADGGDAPVRPYDTKETLDAIVEFAAALGGPATRLLALGGDHSLAYANIKAAWAREGRPKKGLALLHLDAHLDTVDRVWDEPWTHASPFLRVIEEGLIDPQRMLSVGIRGPLNRKDDLDFARTQGIRMVGPHEAAERGPAIAAAFVKALKGAPAYLTFDIDVVDPAFAPGTGTPCCGGLSSLEALRIVRAAAGMNIVGADVVEVLPDRDVADITAMLAAQVAMEILGLAALKPAPPSARSRRTRR